MFLAHKAWRELSFFLQSPDHMEYFGLCWNEASVSLPKVTHFEKQNNTPKSKTEKERKGGKENPIKQKGRAPYIANGNANGAATLENSLASLQKLNMQYFMSQQFQF